MSFSLIKKQVPIFEYSMSIFLEIGPFTEIKTAHIHNEHIYGNYTEKLLYVEHAIYIVLKNKFSTSI